MKGQVEYLGESRNVLKPAADILFDYLRDAIYDPSNALLDLEQLPGEFRDFGKGLQFYNRIVYEMTALAKELAGGNLNCDLPSPSNEIAAPLKMLHASLRHLTWQAQQVANGDYHQRVDFMGDFSEAFNNMIRQLEERRILSLDEKSRLELYVELMLANCPDPILLFNLQGRLAYVSNSYLQCSGGSEADQILGKGIRELFAPAASEDFICSVENLFETVLKEKRTIKTEQDIDLSNNGMCRHYQMQLTPMLDAGGDNHQGVMVLMHDTTEIVRTRREAEHARELAEQSSRAKSDFLSRMSHEMRTPMNAIIGMTTIGSASDDPQRKDYCLEKISEASRHLLGVINDILDMSKIEADKFELSYNRSHFRNMIERLTESVMFRATEHGQRLSVTIDPDIPEAVDTDEQRLAQVISNLLSNAVKFTQDGGDISLTAGKIPWDNEIHSWGIRITVTDNGIGISEEHQERLFVPFEQAEGGFSRKFGGTGLGLAVSRRIIEMMGGNIRVESEIGKGSSFAFEIPVAMAETEASGQPRPAFPEKGGPEPNEQDADASKDNIFSGRRVLLAEDVEINREIAAALLEHTGVLIDPANDGVEAFEKFAAAPGSYDLILMDIHMPGMDGYEATRRIRGSGLPGADVIPIIAMTANVFREDIERCLACGMNSHLGKPIDPNEVIERLKEYLP